MASSSSSDSEYAECGLDDPLGEPKARAQAISAESDLPDRSFKPPVHPKSESETARIVAIMRKQFLFNSLEPEDAQSVIGACEKVPVARGTVLIRQGEEGDCLYIVDSGSFGVFKKTKPSDEGNGPRVNTMTTGQVVGELALLYSAPRAATVIAEDDALLWKLGRETFTFIVKGAAMRKREQLLSILVKIPLLKDCNQQQLVQLADAACTVQAAPEQALITQGEIGDAFYILLNGRAEVMKNGVCVLRYTDGDYFGELALLNNEPRAASVIAKAACKLIRFDVATFNRVLEPLQGALREKALEYVDEPLAGGS